MSEKKLSELESTVTLQDTDLIEVAVDVGGGEYESKKITFLKLCEQIAAKLGV